MTRYALYYHPIPFRGHFIRYVLAHAGAGWDEPGHDEVLRLKNLPVGAQPVPLMAPPMLHDREGDIWLAQMPAILAYLGRVHGLMPGDAAREALTLKLIGDANDVLEEITCDCGARMWTRDSWEEFATARLPRWMAIFEETGRRHGMRAESGFILGGAAPGLADLVAAALWHTMADRLPPLRNLLHETAPMLEGLADRIAAQPGIAAMLDSWQDRRPVYCAGQIEASLLEMLEMED